MQSTNREFISLMHEQGFTRREVATMLKVNLSTIDRYMVPATIKGSRNPTYRKVSQQVLAHFKLILETQYNA